MISLIHRIQKEMTQTNLFTKQKHNHRLGERFYGYEGGRMGERNSKGVWDGHVHTAIFKKDNQQGPTCVEHRELCSMLYGSLDERGV